MRLLTLAALLMLGGCVIAVNTDDWEHEDGWKARQKENERVISRLQIGDLKSEIRDELGRPDFNESFIREGQTYTVLYYRTRHLSHDGETTRDETTPLVFVDNELVGWGESAVDHALVD